MVAFAASANASILFSISPSDTLINTFPLKVGDQISVSIMMDIDTTYYFKGGQFRLQLDTSEVLPLLTGTGKPTLTNTDVIPVIGSNYINNEIGFAIADYDSVTIGAGSYNIATTTLLLQDPLGIWDGADVILGAASADGMYNYDMSVQYPIPGPLHGPNYALMPPVPLPGAIYLFASGLLVGLISIRSAKT